MNILADAIKELDVIVASLLGSFVYMLNQRKFGGKKKHVVFIVSFWLGMVGADITLVFIQGILPASLWGERKLGAFICSAFVVTVISKLIKRIDKHVNN